MKVLVTGNLGYVGNVLTRMLLNQKFDVTGYDVGFYPQGFLGLENFEYYFFIFVFVLWNE